IRPNRHRSPVNASDVSLAHSDQLVAVPLADGLCRHMGWWLERIERASLPSGLFALGIIANLNFMAMFHGGPGILPRVWKPDENTRIRFAIVHSPFPANDKVGPH